VEPQTVSAVKPDDENRIAGSFSGLNKPVNGHSSIPPDSYGHHNPIQLDQWPSPGS
jgi:hypothetical protein